MPGTSYSLAVIAASDIKKMTLAERLQAMELLWESISASPEKVASPAWHGKVLASRLATVKAGKGTFLTIQQIKARLAKKRP
jgi:putative addiction module component (TIGR02574 family)